jgi:hypothetical protein
MRPHIHAHAQQIVNEEPSKDISPKPSQSHFNKGMECAVGLEPSQISTALSLPLLNHGMHSGTNEINFDNAGISASGEEFDELKSSLVESLDRITHAIFCVCGLVWKDNNTASNILQNTWNCTLLVIMAAPAMYMSEVFSRFYGSSKPETVFYLSVLLFSCWFQAVAVSLSNIRNGFRLQLKCNAGEIASFERVKWPTLFSAFIAMIGTALVPFSLYGGHEVRILSTGVFVPLAVVNAINLQFLLADAHYAHTLLMKMATKVNEASFSLHDVDFVRTEVSRVLDKGFISATSLMVCALVNLACFLIVVLLFAFDQLNDFFIFFFREIVFALVGLYFVACANEASKHCTYILGRRLTAGHVPSTVPSTVEVTRISIILQSLQSCPVEFSLVSMVLTRKDILVRFGLWLAAVTLSFVSRALH